jgi:hypothetical protein
MKEDRTHIRDTKKPKKKSRRRDEFRGPITGFIDLAINKGDVTAYSETIYMGDAEEIVEPAQVPSKCSSLPENVH